MHLRSVPSVSDASEGEGSRSINLFAFALPDHAVWSFLAQTTGSVINDYFESIFVKLSGLKPHSNFYLPTPRDMVVAIYLLVVRTNI